MNLLLDIMEPDGTTLGRNNEPLDLLQAHAAGSTEEFSTTSCEGLRRTANTYMKRIGENFSAFAHTVVAGTNIYVLWKGYLSREVRGLASMDIRYIEEAIKTENNMTTVSRIHLPPVLSRYFPLSFLNIISPGTETCCKELSK